MVLINLSRPKLLFMLTDGSGVAAFTEMTADSGIALRMVGNAANPVRGSRLGQDCWSGVVDLLAPCGGPL